MFSRTPASPSASLRAGRSQIVLLVAILLVAATTSLLLARVDSDQLTAGTPEVITNDAADLTEVRGSVEELTRESGIPVARGPRWWPQNLQTPTKYGFIRPVVGVNVGHRVNNLTEISGLANDGPHGLTIDQNFINQNQSAPWLTTEAGQPVISGISSNGVCLNITTTITLRDSSISCPTRTQSDRWGYVGRADHAPAINVLAPNVTIEHNTVTCTGLDNNICSRTIWGGNNSLIQFNNLSGAAGIVELTTNTRVQYNYMHGLAFGADRRQQNFSNNGGITHNNVINSLGYPGGTVIGNYIEATYQRVSANPQQVRTTQYLHFFDNGIIEVGDPLNGFIFAHYPTQGSGEGYVARNNYIESASRAMLCQPSNTSSGCGADISYNAFAQHYFNDFGQQPMFRSTRPNGTFNGECNYTLNNANDLNPQLLPNNIFDNNGTHNTTNCFLVN